MSSPKAQSVLFPEGWEIKRQHKSRLMGCGAIGIQLCKSSCQRLIMHLAVLSIHAKLKTKWRLAKPQLILPWQSLSDCFTEFLVSVEGWRFAYVQCEGLDKIKTYERGFVLLWEKALASLMSKKTPTTFSWWCSSLWRLQFSNAENKHKRIPTGTCFCSEAISLTTTNEWLRVGVDLAQVFKTSSAHCTVI